MHISPDYEEASVFAKSPPSTRGQRMKKKRARKYTYKCKEVSSFKIFQKYVKHTWSPTTGESTCKCDATAILSSECYQDWLNSRRAFPKKPEEAFRRALTAHCRGVDGRRPFSPEVEVSLLSELRKKQQWKCFRGNDKCGSIGVQGFPSLGYHEKLRSRDRESQSPCSKRWKPTPLIKVEESVQPFKVEQNLDNFIQDMEIYEQINLSTEAEGLYLEYDMGRQTSPIKREEIVPNLNAAFEQFLSVANFVF